ncbi:MAG: type II secretion system secretin GspD [Deltaproteobacteria bacterium]|nr:type II secretion system secretin GspD [Deltaproteobacteria bacterium]
MILTVPPFIEAQTDTSGKVLKSSKNKTAAQGSQNSERFISIDFNDVDINVFIKFISELTSKNFVVDQRVKGKVTIISPTVKAGEVTKIIPSPDARSKNIETRLKEEAASPEDRVVTQLIPLKFASSSEIKKLFAPLVSKNSVILAYPPTNMLIITDVYSNIKRLIRILNAIDVSGMGQELTVIPLEYADSAKFVKILDSVFQKKRKTKAPDLSTVKFVADDRTNTIIVMASEVETSRIKKLIEMLDRETPRGKGKIHVYYLENANAEDLAKVLRELPTKKAGTPQERKLPFISEKVKLAADKATNSLIIMAGKEDYQVLDEIIKKLDIPRAMVYIECLLMEVDVNKDFKLGVEWMTGGKTTIGGKDAAFGGTFSSPLDILGTTPLATLPTADGLSMAVITEAITIGNITFPNLAAVINAYQKDKDVHILSTPQLLTMDNQEAVIIVGKNIPYQTRSAADSGVETYSSYEYKDVGITLKITPQISKDRLVQLDISQELTKLDEATASTASEDRPTTLKRSIDTTVIVKDGSTVVIGGLIDEIISEIEYSVPCLGDIPFFGYLFKSTSRGSEKTNLYVFIQPTVVNNPAEAQALLESKQDQVDQIKAGRIKMYEKQPDSTGSEAKQ